MRNPLCYLALINRNVAEHLERGVPSLVTQSISRGYERLARNQLGPLTQSPVRVVAFFGSTLGGSWRTPCAIATCRALANQGLRVGFISHAYQTRLRSSALVTLDSHHDHVGDEALITRQTLPQTVPVCCAANRAEGVEFLLQQATFDVIVSDGSLHGPNVCRVLSLDTDRPWGAGFCPPAGDLRAPITSLLVSADHVCLVRDVVLPETIPLTHIDTSNAQVHQWSFDVKPFRSPYPSDRFSKTSPTPLSSTEPSSPVANDFSSSCRATNTCDDFESLRNQRLFYVSACARPDRIIQALRRRNLTIEQHIRLPDHGGARARELLRYELCTRRNSFDQIVLTARCLTTLATELEGLPFTPLSIEVSTKEPLSFT